MRGLERSKTICNLSAFSCAVALAIAFAAMVGAPPAAAEGMWTMNTLDRCPFDQWRAKGLALGTQEIYNPGGTALADAVVQVGGGTGSFVSPNGLILTNHHVAFGALQRQSSVETNYIEDGFLARTLADEIPALAYEVRCLLSIEDVTKQVLSGVNDKTPDKERHDKIEANIKKIVQKAEKGKDTEASVRGFYDGAEYHLYTYFKIKDIRIVYAPPASIGNYGGDIDNWIWPRHTGDFSFLRAYVAPDGKSAEYAQENVPFKPEKHLAFSTAPLKEGDLTMVVGFPGRTSRYRSSIEMDYTINTYYPRATQNYREVLDILEGAAKTDPESAIKNASTIQGFNNGWKNNVGMLDGLKKYGVLDIKLAEEKELRDFMAANPEMQKKYGTVLDDIAAQYAQYRQFADLTYYMTSMTYTPVMVRTANTIYRWSKEHEIGSDLEREPGYQDRDEPRLKKGLGIADLQYYEKTEKKVLAHYLYKCLDLPGGQKLAILEAVVGGKTGDEAREAIDAYINGLYTVTKVTNKDERMKMFGMKLKDLEAVGDPMIAFVAALEAQRKALESRTDAFDGALSKLRPKLQALRQAKSGAHLYPDANGTMRLSVGEVKGYASRDAVTYGFQTRLGGVVEKHTGEEPFDCPDALLALYNKRDFGRYADPATKDVPVCFVSTDDITGGNSGSPILNGKGDCIGVIFDGNLEAVSADYYFMPELTRAISVDARYILFVLDKFSGAKELLGEMTIR